MGILLSTGTSSWTNLINGVTNMMDLSGTMLDAILAHPIYAGLFGVGFITAALGIVSALKHA